MRNFILLSFIFVVLVGCEKSRCGCAPPLSSGLMGKWNWIKTVTPSGTITPQTAGYNRIFQYENEGYNYIAFYKNDSLYLKLLESRNFGDEDLGKLTILKQYGSQYMKYYLNKNTGNGPLEMQTSELMNTYSEKADTVRHYYVYSNR